MDDKMEEDAFPDAVIKSEMDTTPAVEANVEQQDTFNEIDIKEKMEDKTNNKCYCEKERVLGETELQCGQCARFYHYECIRCYIGGTCIPFMTNYTFCCKRCSPSDVESFTRKTASFTQMCVSALANLTHQHKNRRICPNVFSKDREIIPFIDKHWENLTNMPRRVKLSWHNTVVRAMVKETELFVCKEENPGDQMFGLVPMDLSVIGPSFEASRSVNVASKQDQKIGPVLPDSLGKTRNYKRRIPPEQSNVIALKQKRGDACITMRLAPSGYPLEFPFNKDGYRYILAESDPHSPHRQAFDESQESAGKPIPGCLYRMFQGSNVLLALHDRAPQLKLSEDRLTVTGEKGYSMVRASHGVGWGSWYYEVKIDEMPDNTATRIGWSQPLGNLQAPCGYDKFSYSWRSKKGTVFHHSRGKHMSPSYGKGDVIGLHIYLPKPADPGKLLPPTYKDMPLVKFKSHLYYEDKDQVTEEEKLLQPCVGSKMSMYLNGELQGEAFREVYEGIYHPTISLYKSATVTVNFGPDLKYPPRDLEDYQPISAFAEIQSVVEWALSDILYHVENEGKVLEF